LGYALKAKWVPGGGAHFGEKEVPYILGIRVGLGHRGWRFERLRGYWGD